MQTASILVRLEMENFKIWTVGHVHAALVALIFIVLSVAGPCKGSDDSSKTISVVGSVALDCNSCSEHHLPFSGAHVAIKCQRGNDVSANGSGSVNDDGSFSIHLDKVELGDLCLAEVVMPNNKLCSLAKTSALTSLEKLSVSTPLVCNDTKKTSDQKLLLIKFSKPEFLSVSKFLKPKYPFKPPFFKPKPLPKLPPLPSFSKPKPFPKPKFLKPTLPPLPSILKPKAFLQPKFFKPKPLLKPYPKGKPKAFLQPKFFKPKPLLKPYPKPLFFKPKPLPKLPHLPPKPLLFKPKPLPKFPPLPPIFKPEAFLKPKYFKPKPLLKPHPKPLLLKPKPLLKPHPKPLLIKPKPLPKLPPKPKFFKPPFPKPKLPPFPSPKP